MSRNHARLHAARWARIRKAVLDRDGWRCVQCGAAGRLECDHVVPLHVDPKQDPYDPANLQALCRGCHVEKTRRENRRERTPAEAAWDDFVAELTGGRGAI